MSHSLIRGASAVSGAMESARLHSIALMAEDIVRKSNERNSADLDRVLQQTNRRS